jgi:hypothetical protein
MMSVDVSEGVIRGKVSSCTDDASTVMKIALGQTGLRGHEFDGKPVVFAVINEGGSESINIEYLYKTFLLRSRF